MLSTQAPLLDHIARIIDVREGESIPVAVLAQALQAPPDIESALKAAHFSASTYSRLPLFRSKDYEVRLLCWSPGQSSAMHGHGSSACAFRVLTGQATVLRLNKGSRILAAGEVTTADDGLHQVANLGVEPLISLHIYAPPLPVDQPSQIEGRKIVVLGGGFCGTALTIHLLRQDDPTLRITLVEPTKDLGRGLAYGTRRPEHGLNVPATGMSLDPDDPQDFLRFARDRLGEVHPTALLPRTLYGEYMEQRLGEAILRSRVRLRVAQSAAVAVHEQGEAWEVRLADGRLLPADEVVLATGHGPTRTPSAFTSVRAHPALTNDPWAAGALEGIQAHERVLLVGTGLTSVDVYSTLRVLGVTGSIHALSRNGRWPRPHLRKVRWEGAPARVDLAKAPSTADALATWLRAQIDLNEAREVPWQAVIDAVRPEVSTIWARLSVAERAVFLRRYRPLWEVHRHRLDAALWTRLQEDIESGALVTHAGAIHSVEGTGATLTVTRRAQNADHRDEYDRVILCCGNESDPKLSTDPLWQQLITDGLVAVDAHGLGVETEESGAVLRCTRGGLLGAVSYRGGHPGPNDNVRRVQGIWALGGLRRPRLFESTAVPELSRQAHRLAKVLAERADAPNVRGQLA